MKNLILTIAVVFGLLVFGCLGQNSDAPNNGDNTHQGTITTQTNETSTSSEYEGDGNGLECIAGMTWNTESDGYSMAGTIIGIENYKGRQTCHITTEIEGGYGDFDIYVDMANENASCVVMNIGGQISETCTNWN